METLLYEKNKLVGEIQDILLSWINGKPEVRSVANLSRSTGVTDSAIRRLLNGGAKIADDSIFKILAHVYDQREYDKLFASLEGKLEVQKWFSKNYAYLKKAPVLQEYIPSSLAEEVTESTFKYSVYKYLAARETPVGFREVKEQFGKKGEIEVERLIVNKLVAVENDFLIVKDKKIRFTKDQVADLLPELTRIYFKRDHAFNGRILEVEGVSKAGYIKILDLYDAFIDGLTTAIKNNPGEIPLIVSGFMDTFTTEPYFEGGNNESSN